MSHTATQVIYIAVRWPVPHLKEACIPKEGGYIHVQRGWAGDEKRILVQLYVHIIRKAPHPPPQP